MRLLWRNTRTAWILRLPERYTGSPDETIATLAAAPHSFPVAEWLERGLRIRYNQPISVAVLTAIRPVQTNHHGILWRYAVDPYLTDIPEPDP